MRLPSRSNALTRRLVFGVATAAIAAVAAWQATAMTMSGPNPAMIVAIDGTNPRALPLVVDQLSAVDGKPGMPREAVLPQIRGALERKPLTTRALRQLAAWEEAQGRMDSSRALLDVGARVGRRDPLLNIMLAKDAARSGDGPVVLRHLDAALSTFPEANREVFPLLTQALVDPGLREGLKLYMGRPWAEPFMLFAAQNGDPVAVLDLALSAPRVQSSPKYERFRSELVSNLVGKGASGRAIAYVQRTAAPSADLTGAGISLATTNPLFAPVTWRLRNDNGIYVSAEAERLLVSVDPAARGNAIERVFALTPGRYTLSAISTAPQAAEQVVGTWSATCLRGKSGDIFASRETRISSGPAVLQFSVPAGCDAVRLSLDLVSRNDQQATEYTIDSLRLSKAGA